MNYLRFVRCLLHTKHSGRLTRCLTRGNLLSESRIQVLRLESTSSKSGIEQVKVIKSTSTSSELIKQIESTSTKLNKSTNEEPFKSTSTSSELIKQITSTSTKLIKPTNEEPFKSTSNKDFIRNEYPNDSTGTTNILHNRSSSASEDPINYQDDLFRSVFKLCPPGSTVVVALLGGVDLMCLTHILALQGYDVIAVTIDHGYRESSSIEAKEVGSVVSSWGVRHKIVPLEYDVPVHTISNFEEVARIKRYEVFERICREHNAPLFVGHNLDDQLETFLMRIRMNSSLRGLSALKRVAKIPITASTTTIYRPLLHVSKDDIRKYCNLNKIRWFEDPTNTDSSLTERNWLRNLIKNGIIDRKELIETFSQASSMLEMLEYKLCELEKYVKAQKDLRCGSAVVTFPQKLLQGDNQLVLARYLYRFLQDISSVKHYHWAYAKIERELVPSMAEGLSIRTYLNLVFEMERIGLDAKISVRRQPMLREDVARNTRQIALDGWSEWFDFDRRFAIRLGGVGNVTVKPYIHKTDQRFIKEMKENMATAERIKDDKSVKVIEDMATAERIPEKDKKFKLTSMENGIPIVLKNGLVVLIPTFGINMGVKSQWKPIRA